jgi:hypothetical protein
MISSMHQQAIKTKYEVLKLDLDARARCLWAATNGATLYYSAWDLLLLESVRVSEGSLLPT